MIKKLRVTVDGKPYEVTVEVPEESDASGAAPPPVSPPAAAVPPPASVAKGSAAPGDVPSPLAGRVVAIDAKVGQKVNEGDRLVTVETMKMNTFVCAAKAGKVTEMLVSVGDTVEEGGIVARIT